MKILFSLLTCFCCLILIGQTISYTIINKDTHIINHTDTITIFWKIDSTKTKYSEGRTFYSFIFDKDSSNSRGYISIDTKTKNYFYLSDFDISKAQLFYLTKNRNFKLNHFFPYLINSTIKVRISNGSTIVSVRNRNGFDISHKLLITEMIFEDKMFPSAIRFSNGEKIYAVEGK